MIAAAVYAGSARRLLDDGIIRIFVTGADGRGLRRLTKGNDFELSPPWSPDGARIAYWSTKGKGRSIHTSSLSGAAPTRASPGAGRVRRPGSGAAASC